MGKHLKLSGKYDRWTVLKVDTPTSSRQYKYVCKCDCGTIRSVLAKSLKNGRSKSCGCYKKERMKYDNRENLTKHGLSGTTEYSSYRKMLSRCYNKDEISYHHYGGRGIKVCDEWLGKKGASNFLRDMGKKPSKKHSLDRINVMGNYEKNNCKWSTRREQLLNRRKIGCLEYFSDEEILNEFKKRKLKI